MDKKGQERNSRDQLLEAACQIADEYGIAALTIRGLATRCNVSVGTVYRFFANKTELSVAAMASFFRQRLFEDFCIPQDQANYLETCKMVATRMEEVLGEYRSTWLRGVQALPAEEMEAAMMRESQLKEHILLGLVGIFEQDSRIRKDQLPEGVNGHTVSALMMSAIEGHLMDKQDINTMLFLVERALY